VSPWVRSQRYVRRHLAGAVAVVFVSLIACSLLLSAVGPAVFAPAGDEPSNAELEAASAEFEGTLREQAAANPNDPAPAAMLANLLASAGRQQEAIAWHERAVALAPDVAAYRLAFGRTLEELGQSADALLQFQRASAIEPDSSEIRLALAQALERRGGPAVEEAAAEYQRISAEAPGTYYAEQANQALARLGAASPVAVE
jgi:cytochrome c-type biogenesis protein CcmH/NrfG